MTAEAAACGMDVFFAVDVDTPSANPKELVMRLPKSARFQSGGAKGSWLPNPETPEGYGFYRAQVAGLMKTYPHITRLVAWFRRDATPMMGLTPARLPAAWQKEFAAEIARTPKAEKYGTRPGCLPSAR